MRDAALVHDFLSRGLVGAGRLFVQLACRSVVLHSMRVSQYAKK
jgi:hypothetical protein